MRKLIPLIALVTATAGSSLEVGQAPAKPPDIADAIKEATARGLTSNPTAVSWDSGRTAFEYRGYCLERWPAGTTIGQPGRLIAVTAWPAGWPIFATSVGCVKGAVEHLGDYLVGRKGSDSFFIGLRLSNGWVVDTVFLATYHVQQAGAYVTSFNKGSNDLLVNVRWWTDGYFIGLPQSNVTYSLAVRIMGPPGLPDGLVVR